MEFGLHFASTTFPERDRSVQFCQEAELAGVFDLGVYSLSQGGID